MEQTITRFFWQYAEVTARALEGRVDPEALASLYSDNMVVATPVGIMPGKNDDELKTNMLQGFEHYRAIGTKAILLESVDVHQIDEFHCVASVSWRGIYRRDNAPDVEIPFVVNYLLQVLEENPKVFGWIAGDEQAVLQEHGIIA